MEKVQLSLERFLPELRDLERKKVFTKDEISDIVAKRRAHEVSLSSRDVKPIDYLRYIEYEGCLERLRKARAARIQTTTKKTLSDHSISAHVTHLHRLSTRRFPASLTLWDAALSHSLRQSSPLLVSRTLTAAIAMHPTNVSYWLMASRWESDGDRQGMGGGNEEGARRLCMRALRFLKGTKGEMDIWKEWLRVEVGFAERMRARWELLGIGKGELVQTKKVVEDVGMDVDGDEEEGDTEVELPQARTEDSLLDKTANEVATKALSGQEAILDGAIVRVVLDNTLSSYSHSLEAHAALISLLRDLPSVLRLRLLAHIYDSLALHHPIGSSGYASAVHLLSTRSLYDVAYDSNVQHAVAAEGEAPSIRVEGEELVDAVGSAVGSYWKVCQPKGKKGKGKEKADVAVWESFCNWLEGIEEEVDDENLAVFITSNLSTALSLAPPSPSLSLLHLRYLVRTAATYDSISSLSKNVIALYGHLPTPAPVSEQIWAASLSISVQQSPSLEEIKASFTAALNSLPYSAVVWELYADWVEGCGTEDVEAWYYGAVGHVLRAAAVPPVDFESTFTASLLPPRELIPRRYISYLVSQDPSSVQTKLEVLLRGSPSLSIDFLTYSLALLGAEVGSEGFRDRMYERIVGHQEARSLEWVTYAGELLSRGEVVRSNEVVKRAMRALKGAEGKVFETRWMALLDA